MATAIDRIREYLHNAEMNDELGCLDELIAAAGDCVRNWQSGDLAGAVHRTQAALEELGIDP